MEYFKFSHENALVAINFQKKNLNIYIMLENFLYQEINDVVAILLLAFLQFII